MVRDFGAAVGRTHQDVGTAMASFAQAYRGAATQRVQSGWSQLSERHVQELLEGCRGLAEALDLAADRIVARKAEALAELVGMAATFAADPVVVATGRELLETLKQEIIQHIAGEVVEAAAEPLFARIEEAMSGLDWSQTDAPGEDGPEDGFAIDHGAAGAHLRLLSGYAEPLRGHAQVLRGGVAGLAF